MMFDIRGPSTSELDNLHRKLEACVKAAADATGCKYEFERTRGYKDLITNYVLGKQFQKHAEALGVEFQDEDLSIEKFVASSDVGMCHTKYQQFSLHSTLALKLQIIHPL